MFCSFSLQLFHSRTLAQEASKDVLCDLLNGLVTVLLDDRLMALEGGPQVMRSVNVLLVKVVENADHTNTMGSVRILSVRLALALFETSNYQFTSNGPTSWLWLKLNEIALDVPCQN